jgi:hypothetical protein
MHKTFLKLLSFLIVVALMVVVLKVLNWLPTAIQKDIMKNYSSIEEAKSKLNIKDIYIPLYFPKGIVWPPSNVLAQKKPYTAVVMEFKDTKGDVVLIISQAESNRFVPDKKIKMTQTREKVDFNLKGRNVNLVVGTYKNEEPYSSVFWNEGKYSLIVTAKLPPVELIKIVESMIH